MAYLRWAALAAVACLITTAGAAPAADQPAVLLHLTDLHLSTNSARHRALFGDRQGDLQLLASALLPRIKPAAVLITGDLTDSKDPHGAGLQQEAEWAAYDQVLEAFAAAGVPERLVFDVRGNHDCFNDAGSRHFLRHSAVGRRGQGPQRAYAHVLQPLPDTHTARAKTSWRRRAAEAEQPGPCPAAVLLGIDASANPGLKNPWNFVGSVDAALLQRVRSEAEAAVAAWPPYCPSPPPLLAYCHFPLSTIDSPGAGARWGPLGAAEHATQSVQSAQGLVAELSRFNASMFVSGHLHTVFGERQHRLHPSGAPDAGRFMAELESGAWKDDRRFRLIALDGGAASFADLYLYTPSSPPRPHRASAAAASAAGWQAAFKRRGFGVVATDPSAAVVDHVALLTWPPDARYSPQPAERADAHAEGAVRALIFPLDAAAAAQAGVHVELAAFLPDGTRLLHADMAAAGTVPVRGEAGPCLFAAAPRVTVFCAASGEDNTASCVPPAAFVDVQVTVRGSSSEAQSWSTSPRQPVALRCRGTGVGRQECWLAPNRGAPAPLGTNWVERLILGFNFPVLMHRTYLLVAALHLGLLLLLPRRLASDPALLRRISSSQLLRPGALLPNGSPTPGTALLRGAAAWVVWPPAALVLCAGVTAAWAPMLAYSLYCLFGPVMAAAAMDSSPLALVFHYGVLGKFVSDAPGPRPWRIVGTPDTLLGGIMHLLFCLVPLTLWVACVVGARVIDPGSGASPSISPRGGGALTRPRRWLTAPQALALTAIAAFNWHAFYRKMWVFCGPWAVLLSPGFAWGAPLAVALVAAIGERPCGARRLGKGE